MKAKKEEEKKKKEEEEKKREEEEKDISDYDSDYEEDEYFFSVKVNEWYFESDWSKPDFFYQESEDEQEEKQEDQMESYEKE